MRWHNHSSIRFRQAAGLRSEKNVSFFARMVHPGSAGWRLTCVIRSSRAFHPGVKRGLAMPTPRTGRAVAEDCRPGRGTGQFPVLRSTFRRISRGRRKKTASSPTFRNPDSPGVGALVVDGPRSIETTVFIGNIPAASAAGTISGYMHVTTFPHVILPCCATSAS